MDLPLNPQIDIYQINRTPFFRRLHRNDSEQLERLKKAYESIRNFDEKPLQIQIKKVRLGKLLRHIKDSLPLQKKSRTENKPRLRTTTKQQIRCEELAKARRVGVEYSRRNYNSTPRLSESMNSTPQKEWLMKKFQLDRRLDYGNKRSEHNRSKIQRTQQVYLRDGKTISTFSRSRISPMREKLRKLLVHYLSEDQPDPDVVNSFEEIAQTKNHLYWDLMGAIKKQQQYIRRYAKFTKNLSKFGMKNNVQQYQDSYVEVFQSKTNIRPCDSEILIRTYRYSDEDEYLPPPSESLLRIPLDLPDDLTDEIPTRDELLNKSMEELNESDNNLIKHLHITVPNLPSLNTSTKIVQEKRFDFAQKFSVSEVIRETVRKESANMLGNLEKAMKH